jgi:hypothetical protein
MKQVGGVLAEGEAPADDDAAVVVEDGAQDGLLLPGRAADLGAVLCEGEGLRTSVMLTARRP